MAETRREEFLFAVAYDLWDVAELDRAALGYAILEGFPNIIPDPATGDEGACLLEVEEVERDTLAAENRHYKDALERIAAQGDQVVTGPDGQPSILTVDREAERLAAMAREALETDTPSPADAESVGEQCGRLVTSFGDGGDQCQYPKGHAGPCSWTGRNPADAEWRAELRGPSPVASQGRETCPTCGSDNPRYAFDVIRPEKPRQPATWTDSAGGLNWICGDPFHGTGRKP